MSDYLELKRETRMLKQQAEAIMQPELDSLRSQLDGFRTSFAGLQSALATALARAEKAEAELAQQRHAAELMAPAVDERDTALNAARLLEAENHGLKAEVDRLRASVEKAEAEGISRETLEKVIATAVTYVWSGDATYAEAVRAARKVAETGEWLPEEDMPFRRQDEEREAIRCENQDLRAERDTALATIEKLVGALSPFTKCNIERYGDGKCPESWGMAMGGKIPIKEQQAHWCVGCHISDALALARCPECLSTPHKMSCSRTEGRPSLTATTDE